MSENLMAHLFNEQIKEPKQAILLYHISRR
jgi:hypothetical protein